MHVCFCVNVCGCVGVNCEALESLFAILRGSGVVFIFELYIFFHNLKFGPVAAGYTRLSLFAKNLSILNLEEFMAQTIRSKKTVKCNSIPKLVQKIY